MKETRSKKPFIIGGGIVAALIIAAAAYYFLVYRANVRNEITKQADVVPVTEIEQYIELKDYKGVEISKIDTTITDEQVDANIQNVVAGQATFTEVERAAREGDVVNIDYVGKIDGTEFAGGADKGFDLELGSGTFIDGFESGLIGKTKGETVDVTTTFPDPYQNPDLAGKEAIFTVTINKVQEKKAAELNDELVAKISQTAKTVDEYKAEVRKNLEEAFRQNAENQQKAELWSKVQQNLTVKKLPEEKITELISQMWTRFEENAKTAGMTKEDAIKASNTTAEEMEKQMKAQAELVLKDQLAVEYISAKEKIVLSDKEYTEGAQKYVASTGVADLAALEKTYGKHDIALSLLYDKVLTELMKQAKVVDPADAAKTQNESSESKTESTGSKTE
ncbi:MAG: trigger factor [Eubacteriales bacterium]|nr:trigger factor [Eubacteriales bacterium]